MKKVFSFALVLALAAGMLSGITFTAYADDVLNDDWSTYGTPEWIGYSTDGLSDAGTINTAFGTKTQKWFDWNADNATKHVTYNGDFGGKALIAYFCVDDHVTNSAGFKATLPSGKDVWGSWYEMYNYFLKSQLRMSVGTSEGNMTLVEPTYIFGGHTPGGGKLAFAVAVDNMPAGTTFVKVSTYGRFPEASWMLRWLGVRVTDSGTGYLTGYDYEDGSTPVPLSDFKDDFSTLVAGPDRTLNNKSVGRKYIKINNFYKNTDYNNQTQLDKSWFVHRVEGPGWDYYPECSLTYYGNFSNKLLSVIVSGNDNFLNNAGLQKSDWRGVAENIGLSVYAGSTEANMVKINPTHYRHGAAEDLNKVVAVDIITESLPEGTQYIKVAYDSANWFKKILQVEVTSNTAAYLAKANVVPAVEGPVVPEDITVNVDKDASQINKIDITSNNVEGTVILAFYKDVDGKKVLEDVWTETVEADDYQSYIASVTVNKAIPSGASHKVMFWDGFGSIKPLCEAAN